jgi:deoxyribodipyrimidine photo-lyase
MTSIFIFTRDLRLYDNTCLIEALKNSTKVLPIFIFNPEQIDNINKYKSDNAVQFMCESLIYLNLELKKKKSKLFFFYGNPNKIVKNIIKELEIESLYITKDYSPFAIKRENELKEICIENKINFVTKEDYTLNNINTVLKDDGTVYLKFTPFHNKAKTFKIREESINNHKNYISNKIKVIGQIKPKFEDYYQYNENILVKGGRDNALKLLNKIREQNNYDNTRNHLEYSTTLLSAYLKFGCISIRETYWIFKNVLKKTNQLFTQLYWRDFYMIILFNFPQILGNPMIEKYKNLEWQNKKSDFERWKNGNTGIPIIDAGMNELNKTGYMHNRARLIVADFLVKILRVDWRFGEKYFANKLIDYDPSNNSGNWNFIASTATFSQPYFRIFNPWRQSQNFDKNCVYIKKWLPELNNIDNKDVHNWFESYKKYKINYPKPMIIDLKKEMTETIKIYKKVI